LWPALAYGGCCAFSLAVVAISTQPLHRRWAACAAVAYGCAALVCLTRLRWRWIRWRRLLVQRDLALAIVVAGALIGPLCWLAAIGQGMPEVGVVAHSAQQLVHHGRPYESAGQLGGNVNGYNPYLPGMTLFGLPQALFGGGVATDPRVWDGLAFVVLFWAALRVAGATGAVRRTAILASSPLIAFPLTVSGNDLPVIGLICLGLALAVRDHDRTVRDRPVAAGLVLGAAAALKATAWPALLIVGVLFLARDGRGAAGRFAAGRFAAGRFAAAAAGVLAVVVGPFLVIQPRDLIENTIAFPLGLTKAHSPAASPLPGHLIAATGSAGHTAVIALMAAGAVGICVALVIRPPRSAVSAAGYLALTLTMLFVLAPATRWGYFGYPIGIGCWLWLSGAASGNWTGTALQTTRGRTPDRPGRGAPDNSGRGAPDNVGGMELRVNGCVVIPDGELHERFSRSSGPGGQSVNTTDSRVELSFDVANSPSLPDWAKARVLQRLAGRLSNGVLTLTASEQRSQLANRQAARARLAALLRDAVAPPQRPRIPTRPSRAGNERRVAAKRSRSATKRTRRYDTREAD